MALLNQSSFTATGIRSLCWRGEELVDWVSGCRAFALDGTERPSSVHYAYCFDAAMALPDGRYAVIYERLGTKGLLLHDGKCIREINRSYYHADAYEYPRVRALMKNDTPAPPATPHHTSHPNSSPTANGVGMKAGKHAAEHFAGDRFLSELVRRCRKLPGRGRSPDHARIAGSPGGHRPSGLRRPQWVT